MQRPRLMPERSVVLVMLSGVATSVALAALAYEVREQQRTAQFKQDASEVAVSIQRAVDDCVRELESISNLFHIFPDTDGRQLAVFVKPYLAHDRVTQALEWVPRVTRAQRTAFEAETQVVLPGFAIREKVRDGGLVAAGDRPEYFPVLYAEPTAGNERAVGFDVASEPVRRTALQHARATATTSATGPIRLVQERATQKGILIFHPTQSEAADLRGFAVGVFRVGDLIDGALRRPLLGRIAVEVFDSAAVPESLLYRSHRGLEDKSSWLTSTRELSVAGRRWLIRIRSGDGTDGRYEAALVLAGALAFTAFVSFYFSSRARSEAQLRKAHDEIAQANTRLARQAEELAANIQELTLARERLVQEEKLTSVGRLAAGIAHEINTPVQFVSDSVSFLQVALKDLTTLLESYRVLLRSHAEGKSWAEWEHALGAAEEAADLAYLLENAPAAVERALDGLSRVATIVRSMKEFAHPDRGEATEVDLNRAIGNTLTIARNEYKYVADLVVDLGELPMVRCYVGELNQTILNIVINAAHAIGDVVKDSGGRGVITVRTAREGGFVNISIADTGTGIPRELWNRIYDPFFTTKEVGKGTGQGLAIARAVIVDRHGGNLSFDTELGKGTTFHIRLPIAGKAGLS